MKWALGPANFLGLKWHMQPSDTGHLVQKRATSANELRELVEAPKYGEIIERRRQQHAPRTPFHRVQGSSGRRFRGVSDYHKVFDDALYPFYCIFVEFASRLVAEMALIFFLRPEGG